MIIVLSVTTILITIIVCVDYFDSADYRYKKFKTFQRLYENHQKIEDLKRQFELTDVLINTLEG